MDEMIIFLLFNKNKYVKIILYKIVILIFFLFDIIVIIFINDEFYDVLKSTISLKIFKQKEQIILFSRMIEKEFKIENRVNLNELESKMFFGRKWEKLKNEPNEINVGMSLDRNFILKTMITTASVIYSQKTTTKLRLHYTVVKTLKPRDMIKIYSLRGRIREDVEFNFYNAKRVNIEIKSISRKGPGLVAKLLLPQLVDETVKRLIIIDTGDLLVLRDLSKMYNWNMNNNMYMGAPDPAAGMYGKISKKPLNVYINAGNYLIDVKKVKQKNMYKLFLKYKNVYRPPLAEQHMLNDIANGKIGYLPVEFGLVPPFSDDELFYNKTEKSVYVYFNLSIISKNSNFLPKNYEEFFLSAYNPIIVHSWNGKWSKGKGLNIYRKLCQFFIELTGIKKEICRKIPGYCIKI
jgi:hypothetical protein